MGTLPSNVAKIEQRQFKQRLNYHQEVYRAMPAEVVSFSKGIATVKVLGVDYAKGQPVVVKAPVAMMNRVHYKLKQGDSGVLIPLAAPLKGGKVFMDTDLANGVFIPYSKESWDWTNTLIDKLNKLVEQLNNWTDGDNVNLKGKNSMYTLPFFDR